MIRRAEPEYINILFTIWLRGPGDLDSGPHVVLPEGRLLERTLVDNAKPPPKRGSQWVSRGGFEPPTS